MLSLHMAALSSMQSLRHRTTTRYAHHCGINYPAGKRPRMSVSYVACLTSAANNIPELSSGTTSIELVLEVLIFVLGIVPDNAWNANVHGSDVAPRLHVRASDY